MAESASMDYSKKTSGRNEEVEVLYGLFDRGKDVSMPGARRLGKSFVLERLTDASVRNGWTTVNIDVSGCSDFDSFFREVCGKIGSSRSGGSNALTWLKQRLAQVGAPRRDSASPWWEHLLSLDYETYLRTLLAVLNTDTERRWALLIDELPIFLKALHDQGAEGVAQARNFMNLTSQLRHDFPKVRWLITGSIGIEPLAKEGNYSSVLSKWEPFQLLPLTGCQAKDFVQDLATTGQLEHREVITDVEAELLVRATGWRAAYYLEALAQKLRGQPTQDIPQAQEQVDLAVKLLLSPVERGRFGLLEEHLRKYYDGLSRTIVFGLLGELAKEARGQTVSTLLSQLGRPDLTASDLRQYLIRLHDEGFVDVSDWNEDEPTCAFLNPLLRLWWKKFTPSPS